MQTKKTSALTFVILLAGAALAQVAMTGLPVSAQPACPIKINQLEWFDMDANGHLDAVKVTTSHDIDHTTVVPNDFLVPSADDSTRRAMGKEATGSMEFWLFFHDGTVLDGGWTSTAPSFTFSPPDLVTRIRQLPSGCTPTATDFNNPSRVNIDRAAPLALAAYSTQGATSFTAVFSEPVSKDGGTTACGTPPAAPGPSCFFASGTAPATDFCFEDASGITRPIYGISPVYGLPARTFTVSLSKTVNSASTTANNPTVTTAVGSGATFIGADVGRRITGTGIPSNAQITTLNGPNSVDIFPSPTTTGSTQLTIFTELGADDVAVQNLALGGSPPARFYAASCATKTTPTFRDVLVDPDSSGPLGAMSNAGLSRNLPGLPAGAVAIGGPYPVRVHGSQGDTRVVVEFNGPVTGSSGPVTNGFSVSGATPNWSVGGVAHSAAGSFGANWVVLTATCPLVSPAPPCLPLAPDNLFMLGGTVKGLDSSAFAPSASWPVTDTQRTAFPRITRLETFDGAIDGPDDGTAIDPPNGCLDAIKLTFNERIVGTNTVPADWTIYWPAADIAVAPTGILDGTPSDNVFFLTFDETPCRNTAGNSPTGAWTLPRISTVADIGARIKDQPPTPGTNPLRFGTTTGILYREPTRDGAPPVVLTARTADCRVPQLSGPPLLVSSGCTPNGKIDGIVLTFSETVPDSDFSAAAWRVRLPATADLACITDASGLTAPLAYAVTSAVPFTETNGAQKLLRVGEVAGANAFDTACVPEVSYFGAPPLRDPGANAWQPFFTGSIQSGTTPDTSGKVTMTVQPGSLRQDGDTLTDTLTGLVLVGDIFQVTSGPAAGTYTVDSFNAASPMTITFAGTNPPTSGAFLFPQVLGSTTPAASEARDGAGPYLTNLQGTPGATDATATFSERPCGWRTPTALPSCPGLQPADFIYRRETGTPNTMALAGVSTPDPAKPNVIRLTLPQPLPSSHMTGSERYCLELIAPTTSQVPGTASTGGVTDMQTSAVPHPSGLNLPWPANGECKPWSNSAAPRVAAGSEGVLTVDSNKDGYLDAVKVTLNKGIVPGTRLLRVGGASPAAGDSVYYDSQPDGVINAGDTVLYGTAPLGSAVSSAVAVLWVELDAPAVGPDVGDGVYADVDASGTITAGDFRYEGGGALADGATVVCGATPNADCDRAVTPTSVNLDATDFHVTFGTTEVLVTCVLTGKSPGTVASAAAGSSCMQGAISGNADPPAGHLPGVADSCSGALAHTLNHSVIYVCFVPWLSASGVPIPNTGQTPKVSYGPCLPNPPGTCMRIRAADNTPMGSFLGADAKTASDGAAPVLVDIRASPGDDRAALHFSEAVKSSAEGNTVRPLDLSYINGNAGTSNCQSGVNSVSGIVGSAAVTQADSWVNATLSGRLTRDDVSGCIQNAPPASVQPSRDGIRPALTLVEQASPGRAAVAKTVFMRDLKGPRLDRAEFIDATSDGVNGDGRIDALRLVFTEPVNDCFGPVAPPTDTTPADGNADFPGWTSSCVSGATGPTYGWPTAPGPFTVKAGTMTLAIRSIVTGQRGVTGEPCLDTYEGGGKPLLLHAGDTAPVFGPADGFGDSTIFLCLNPDHTPESLFQGTRGLGTSPVGMVCYDGPPTSSAGVCTAPGTPVTACPAPPAAIPTGLVCDMANVGPYTTASPLPAAGNPMADFNGTIRDAGRPVVNNATTDDRDHNGKVDAIRINFSEPVNSTTIVLTDWSVEGRQVTGVALPAKPNTCLTTVKGDALVKHVWLCLTEVTGESTYDTGLGHAVGTGPRVSYASGGGVRDKSTPVNALRGFTGTATDGAQPVVVRLLSQPGSATTTVTFSEGVDGSGSANSATLSITYSDLSFEEHADAQSGAKGFGGNQVVHSPGDVAAVLTLDAPVTAYDFANDRICFVAGAIREHGGGLALFDTCFGLNGVAGDRIPPPPPEGLTTKLPAITLEWETPDDPDVVTIEVYVCNTEAGSTCTITLDSIRGAGGSSPVLALSRAAQRGMTETYQYVPTDPDWKSLSFAVATVDSSQNRALSAVVTEVPQDVIAPEPVTGLSVLSASPTSLTLTFDASHDDAGSTGSDEADHYEIYAVQGTRITAAQLTPANQRPDVGGRAPGMTVTAVVSGLLPGTTYTLAVIPVDEEGNMPDLTDEATVTGATESKQDPTPITAAAIRTRNMGIQVEATRSSEGNVVNWTLPAELDGFPTQGVQIWRCPGAAPADCILVGNLTRTSSMFKDGSFTDRNGGADDHYLVTAYYGQSTAEGRAGSTSDANSLPGFGDMTPVATTGTASEGLLGLPWWVWIVGGIVLLLLLVALIMVAMRKRGGTIEPGAPAEGAGEWPAEGEAPVEGAEASEGAAAAAPASAAGPAQAEPHHITCPKCSTEFTVTGVKPMAIECPNCGVKGVLR